ncbi:putative aldouronate transport system substrate-binding protein [Pullulanibacillus pueri]|uniref:ABC transporter substrate-binding protein n=1 Tax=Pullulanibacillus pueri TaxID=1437324 RepID=A0A8J2ZVM0_9BACL|nr:ABC transporter substrate-binding protein [Pullulanibacillus pueri]MBM7682086.1 putative aldouronate transport system substrate-binding protein [Pullulanibacillus pueri]GGH80037.1 ABC transporter substrate-binding protein [Pullulanibacillus pueri]
MRRLKKLTIGLVGILVLSLLMAGCGSLSGNASKNTDSKKGVTTLLMYQIGDKPENYDQLMDAANKIVEKKIGARINLQYIGWGDYDKKMSVIVSSGENYDIAYANNYVANAQKGAYADLTDLAPKYAKEAYDMLDPAYIEGNKIKGKLYAFPVNGNVYAQQMLTFNKQYLDKYHLDISNVNSYADLEPLLKVIKKNEKTVMPIAAGQGFHVESDMDYPLSNGMPFAVDLKGDHTKIINQYDNERMKQDLRTMHKYYQEGYIAKDAATSNTDYPLDGNTWFVRQETQGPYDYGDTLLTTTAGQPLVSRPLTDAYKTTGQAQMANFVVSSNSKHKEKAVEFLGLLNSDPDLLNGLIYGEEGKAWKKVGDNKVKLLDGYKANNHMAAWNTGNNKIVYVQDSITDQQIKERDENIKNAKQSPILGFNFNTDSVKTEITNISNVMSQYLDGLNTGTLDPDKAIPEMDAKLKKAGYDKVLKEMQKQFDEFRASKE